MKNFVLSHDGLVHVFVGRGTRGDGRTIVLLCCRPNSLGVGLPTLKEIEATEAPANCLACIARDL